MRCLWLILYVGQSIAINILWTPPEANYCGFGLQKTYMFAALMIDILFNFLCCLLFVIPLCRMQSADSTKYSDQLRKLVCWNACVVTTQCFFVFVEAALHLCKVKGYFLPTILGQLIVAFSIVLMFRNFPLRCLKEVRNLSARISKTFGSDKNDLA